MVWPIQHLFTPPRTFPARDFKAAGVKALFYEGEPARGKATRVFAWYGAPPVQRGEKVPAMILVHGGGGTAFPYWVRMWNERGYAALAMDTCGGVPGWTDTAQEWPRHAHSGPNGWGRFEEFQRPPRSQWMYHAVAAVIRGNSLLRSLPEVDADRIGMTGVSWGGVLACVAAGLDERFRFAAPVYGCGYLDDPASGLYEVKPARRWFDLWDPKHYLPKARCPMLWVNGTNDFAFPLVSYQKSYRAAGGERSLAIRVRMPHGHGGAGEHPEELRVFADALLRGGKPLPKIVEQSKDSVTWQSESPIKRVEFNYTRAKGYWTDRFWNTVPAKIEGGRATIKLPKATTVGFFNVFDERECVVSSEHVEFLPRA